MFIFFVLDIKNYLSEAKERKLKEKIDLQKNIPLSKLVKRIGLEKINSEYGKKYNFLIVEDKNKQNNYTI